jgi:hypothetical protein
LLFCCGPSAALCILECRRWVGAPDLSSQQIDGHRGNTSADRMPFSQHFSRVVDTVATCLVGVPRPWIGKGDTTRRGGRATAAAQGPATGRGSMLALRGQDFPCFLFGKPRDQSTSSSAIPRSVGPFCMMVSLICNARRRHQASGAESALFCVKLPGCWWAPCSTLARGGRICCCGRIAGHTSLGASSR